MTDPKLTDEPESRIEFTAEQLRKFVRTVWDEAFSDGNHCSGVRFQAADCNLAWMQGHSRNAMEKLISIGYEPAPTHAPCIIEEAYKEGWWDGKNHGREGLINMYDEARENDWSRSSSARYLVSEIRRERYEPRLD